MELSVFNCISQTKVLVFGRKTNYFVRQREHGGKTLAENEKRDRKIKLYLWKLQFN